MNLQQQLKIQPEIKSKLFRSLGREDRELEDLTYGEYCDILFKISEAERIKKVRKDRKYSKLLKQRYE